MTEQTRRATRLLEIHRLLVKRGSMSAAELSQALDYSPRTIQRDLLVLESELRVPLIYEGRRYRIMPGGQHPLGPIRFTTQEARVVHMATRLFIRYADEFDPDGMTALEKNRGHAPSDHGPPGRTHRRPAARTPCQCASDGGPPPPDRGVGWLANRADRVPLVARRRALLHRASTRTSSKPSAGGAATYVVGFSSRHAAVRIFKIDRVESVELTTRHFEARDVDEIVEQLERSWGGVVFGDDHYDVTVDFTPGSGLTRQ